MKVVIDTNVMLTLFKKGHANRPIYEARLPPRQHVFTPRELGETHLPLFS